MKELAARKITGLSEYAFQGNEKVMKTKSGRAVYRINESLICDGRKEVVEFIGIEDGMHKDVGGTLRVKMRYSRNLAEDELSYWKEALAKNTGIKDVFLF